MAVNTPGPKTVFAPSDGAVAILGGITNLTEDVLKSHIFDGMLTADVLVTRSEIVAVNGEVFKVSHQVVSNRGRRALLISVFNNKSRSVLTVLDIPYLNGVVHGVDAVFERDDDLAGGSTEGASNSTSKDELGQVEWALIAIVLVLFCCLFCLVLVCACRDRRREKDLEDVKHPYADDIAEFYSGVPQHFYAGTMSQPQHFYPETRFQLDSTQSDEPGQKKKRTGGRSSRHTKLSTPAWSSTRPATLSQSDDPGYVDPSPH